MILIDVSVETFLAVVSEGTVHAASKKIGLSQTGVTQRIRSLEERVGISLFIRSKKGMRLTSEGQIFLQFAKQAQELDAQAKASFQMPNECSQKVVLTGPSSFMEGRLDALFETVMPKFPKLHFKLDVSDAEDRVEVLKRGHADLAVVPEFQVSNELDSKRLRPEQFVLVCSTEWHQRTLQAILTEERIIDFHEDDRTTYEYLQAHGLAQDLQRERLFVNNNSVLIAMLVQGLGFGVLPKALLEGNLLEERLMVLNQSKPLNKAMGLAWLPRTHMPEMLQTIIDAIR